MRLLVYEYTCAHATERDMAADALHCEGWAMLRAVLDDLARVRDVDLVTVLAAPLPVPAGVACCLLEHASAEEAVLRGLAREVDLALVIAPEFEDILARRCDWIETEGGRLLGPSAAAVRLTADKLALCRHLQAHAVPTPATHVWPLPGQGAATFPAVWKPRYGAGSQATFLVRDAAELAAAEVCAAAEGWKGEAVLQPWVPGRAASVAFLLGPAGSVALLPAAQHLSEDGRLHYQGGELPLPEPLAGRAVTLARRACAAVSELRGYVGVDLVLGDAPDGSEDQVIEINPRLTTSYVGLRALARDNLGLALLQASTGGQVSLAWRPGRVRFRAEGGVEWLAPG